MEDKIGEKPIKSGKACEGCRAWNPARMVWQCIIKITGGGDEESDKEQSH